MLHFCKWTADSKQVNTVPRPGPLMDGAGRRKLVQKWWCVSLTGEICIVYRVLQVAPCVESSRWKLYCVHNEMNDDVCGWFRPLSLQRPLIKHSLSHLLGARRQRFVQFFRRRTFWQQVLVFFFLEKKTIEWQNTTHLLPLMKSSANDVTAHTSAFDACGAVERKFPPEGAEAARRIQLVCVFCTLTQRRPCNCHFYLSENGARWLESLQWTCRVTRIFPSFLGQFHSLELNCN